MNQHYHRQISSEDLKAELFWLIQHGIQEQMDCGMSYQEAERSVKLEEARLKKEIAEF